MTAGWDEGEARGARTGAVHSLFGEILDWMFAPLLLLWPMSVSLTYLVAQSIAAAPFDHDLLRRARVLAEHVQFDGGRARLDLPAATLEPLLVQDANSADDASGGGAFLVIDPAGRAIAGDGALPLPERDERIPAQDGFVLATRTLRGREVRVAYGWVAPPGALTGTATAGPDTSAAAPAGAALVELAEPMGERAQLANEIIKGVILPQFVVLPLALLLVWFGLTRGLAPLTRLQETIRGRRPDDLAPIPQSAAPEEITPLLASFNELLARMRRSLELQDRFIADAAHQMKTPLAGLRTQAELAQRESDPHELQRSLRQIATSTERATRMINQLLALAHAEHGASGTAALAPLDLDAFARSVVQDWVQTALAQRVDLGYEGPEQAAPGASRILGAGVLLRELLNNLIDNALRYSNLGQAAAAPPGDSELEPPAVTVRVRVQADEIALEVEDHGPGIAPEDRDRVFERFYRVLGSGRDGSGLGLAIVREIAGQHGATVEVEPARDDPRRPGARFRVRFEPYRDAAGA